MLAATIPSRANAIASQPPFFLVLLKKRMPAKGIS
jgi:hypothetical protein